MRANAAALPRLGGRNDGEGCSGRDRGKQDFPHDALLAHNTRHPFGGTQVVIERSSAAIPSRIVNGRHNRVG